MMKRFAIASLSVLLTAPITAKADIFHCKRAGAMYADKPCGENYRTLQFKRFVAPAVTAIASNEAGARYIVSGEVDGVSTDFVVDTGATITSVPESKRDAFGLGGECRVTNFDTANGSSSGCIYKARRLKVGAIELEDVLVAAMPNLKTPLLGMNAVTKLKIGSITDTEIIFIKK